MDLSAFNSIQANKISIFYLYEPSNATSTIATTTNKPEQSQEEDKSDLTPYQITWMTVLFGCICLAILTTALRRFHANCKFRRNFRTRNESEPSSIGWVQNRDSRSENTGTELSSRGLFNNHNSTNARVSPQDFSNLLPFFSSNYSRPERRPFRNEFQNQRDHIIDTDLPPSYEEVVKKMKDAQNDGNQDVVYTITPEESQPPPYNESHHCHISSNYI